MYFTISCVLNFYFPSLIIYYWVKFTRFLKFYYTKIKSIGKFYRQNILYFQYNPIIVIFTYFQSYYLTWHRVFQAPNVKPTHFFLSDKSFLTLKGNRILDLRRKKTSTTLKINRLVFPEISLYLACWEYSKYDVGMLLRYNFQNKFC